MTVDNVIWSNCTVDYNSITCSVPAKPPGQVTFQVLVTVRSSIDSSMRTMNTPCTVTYGPPHIDSVTPNTNIRTDGTTVITVGCAVAIVWLLLDSFVPAHARSLNVASCGCGTPHAQVWKSTQDGIC